jgi:uncharacterized membrane protein YagU involved in acid resistance
MLRTLFATALLVGTLDISCAIGFSYLRSGTPPARLLQSVASGALGRDAYNGGARTAALGLAIHYFIATTITALYFAAASRVRALIRRPLVFGAIYGFAVYVVMNWVVIPLSRIGPRGFPATVTFVTGVLVHMFLIGAPIAAGARRALRHGRGRG